MIKLIRDRHIYDEVIENGIKLACRSVWISTANLKNAFYRISGDRAGSMLGLFDELVGRGVEVRLLHASIPSGMFLKEMKEHAGLFNSPLFGMKKCVRTHFKVVLIDSGKLYLGSANLTGAGIGIKGTNRRNFELGIVTDEDFMMDMVAEYYESIWNGSRCGSCDRKRECVIPLESPGCG